MTQKISVLGSTGSIGTQTLQVAKHLGLDVVGLAAHSGGELLEEQIRAFKPKVVAVFDPDRASVLQKLFPNLEILSGMEGICAVASMDEAETVVMAILGLAALDPTIAAIEKGKRVALSSKEVLVGAGSLVMEKAKSCGATIIPVDSEHSALFQCLQTGAYREVNRLILTASGGPFFGKNSQELKKITVDDALNHPTWKMGAKISVDSSTLMNKGLEVIEAKVLFDVPLNQIEVIVHPQSVIHSIVEWCDGSMIAQMGAPSMHVPIQYALTYPKRGPAIMGCFDFTKYSTLDFHKADEKNFICLKLAFDAAEKGGSAPCFLNGANEVLVRRFLDKEISWSEIGKKLKILMDNHEPIEINDLKTVHAVDNAARGLAKEI